MAQHLVMAGKVKNGKLVVGPMKKRSRQWAFGERHSSESGNVEDIAILIEVHPDANRLNWNGACQR
jgi:hypothetical protein